MINTISKPRSSGALQSLLPVLEDIRYFLHRSAHTASPSLRSQIEAALEDFEVQLTPAPNSITQQLVSRMMLHFPCPAGEQQSRVCADYTAVLQEFPEDLLCAAYVHILKHHKYRSLPKIADFLIFMEPEMIHRRVTKRKLDILLKQAMRPGVKHGVNA